MQTHRAALPNAPAGFSATSLRLSVLIPFDVGVGQGLLERLRLPPPLSNPRRGLHAGTGKSATASRGPKMKLHGTPESTRPAAPGLEGLEICRTPWAPAEFATDARAPSASEPGPAQRKPNLYLKIGNPKIETKLKRTAPRRCAR